MESINGIVISLIEEHEGGEEFFNHLDKSLQNISILKKLFFLVEENVNIVASGKFGLYLNSQYKNRDILLVNGGLRKGNIISLEPMKKEITGKEFIFIDDSFYKGRTRNKIKTEIEKYGGVVSKTIVCYDGSREKDITVESLYRYYDNFPKKSEVYR